MTLKELEKYIEKYWDITFTELNEILGGKNASS